jgi:hypothetical protein
MNATTKIRPDATAAHDWRTLDALRGVVRPFRSGSAYGVARVESHDGSRTVVHGLHERSKQWANVDEVTCELNIAHRDALALTLDGESNRYVARRLLGLALDLTATELDTAAVLLCDLFQLDTEDGDGVDVLLYLAYAVGDDPHERGSRSAGVLQAVHAAVTLNK